MATSIPWAELSPLRRNQILRSPNTEDPLGFYREFTTPDSSGNYPLPPVTIRKDTVQEAASLDLPMTIRVGPFHIRVERSLRAPDGNQEEGRFGYCDYTKQLIWIDADLPEDSQAETLLHEILHWVWYATQRERGKWTNEEFIQRVSPTLLLVLRDNPHLVHFLTEAS